MSITTDYSLVGSLQTIKCRLSSANHQLQLNGHTKRTPPHTHSPPAPALSIMASRSLGHTHTHTCLRNSEPPRCTHAAKHSSQPPLHHPTLISQREEPHILTGHLPELRPKAGRGGVDGWRVVIASGWRVAGERLASGWRAAGERLATGSGWRAAGEQLAGEWLASSW